MIPMVLGEFARWLAAPRPIVPHSWRDGWRAWLTLVGAYLVGLAVLGAVVLGWQRVLHLPSPTAFQGYTPRALALMVLLAAPVGEEIAFRGWLTGRPRALWLMFMGVIGTLLLFALTRHWADQAAALGCVATLGLALLGWVMLRHGTQPPRWFTRGFGICFYASVAAFGLAHLMNYPRLSWVLVPMVLPQVWAGLVFGYIRMRHGLPASILAHACGNAAALVVAIGLGG